METCYMCDQPQTGKEHVPPRCIFPEGKDSPRKTYRTNLFTVPSCDAHNSRKSKEDEFFLIYMASCASANQVGILHQQTKLMRIVERKPHVFAEMLKNSMPATLDKGQGRIEETCAFLLDRERVNTQLEHIARALYFWHYKSKWLSPLIVIPLQGLTDSDQSANAAAISIAARSAGLLRSLPRLGSNQDVFYYQVVDDEDGQVIHAVFFDGMKIAFAYPTTFEHEPLES
ncbi:hypothetical protein [uncultured Pseudomonas sp.]|uniref:hypothetical protein n=1 Tax=uncultured Pseudomonas sp. TaxID=114707 RepID=UPI0025CBF765|nr:hypothetical protein [uncultured Pseudomonas sp.]